MRPSMIFNCSCSTSPQTGLRHRCLSIGIWELTDIAWVLEMIDRNRTVATSRSRHDRSLPQSLTADTTALGWNHKCVQVHAHHQCTASICCCDLASFTILATACASARQSRATHRGRARCLLSVVPQPRLKRTEPSLTCRDTPIASSTWDGTPCRELHEAPVEAAIPSKSKLKTSASPLTPAKRDVRRYWAGAPAPCPSRRVSANPA